MPAKTLVVHEKAHKHFQKLPHQIQKRTRIAYHTIKDNPILGEKLHGELSGYYKYRLGDYRIVYSFDTKTSTVTVVTIEHRQGVYR